jgi:hypothetical protein
MGTVLRQETNALGGDWILRAEGGDLTMPIRVINVWLDDDIRVEYAQCLYERAGVKGAQIIRNVPLTLITEAIAKGTLTRKEASDPGAVPTLHIFVGAAFPRCAKCGVAKSANSIRAVCPTIGGV